MNSQPAGKPFYIIDPLALIDLQKLSTTFQDCIVEEFSGSRSLRSPITREFVAKWVEMATFKDIFDFDVFFTLLKNKVPLLSESTKSRCMNYALSECFKSGYNIDSIKSLLESGNVSLFIGPSDGSLRTHIEHAIAKKVDREIASIRVYDGDHWIQKYKVANVREDDWSFHEKVKNNNLTLVQQTDLKKKREEKIYDFALELNKQNPHIVCTRIGQLHLFNEERRKTFFGDPFKDSGLELSYVGPKIEMALGLPKFKQAPTIKELLSQPTQTEGARPPIGGAFQ